MVHADPMLPLVILGPSIHFRLAAKNWKIHSVMSPGYWKVRLGTGWILWMECIARHPPSPKPLMPRLTGLYPRVGAMSLWGRKAQTHSGSDFFLQSNANLEPSTCNFNGVDFAFYLTQISALQFSKMSREADSKSTTTQIRHDQFESKSKTTQNNQIYTVTVSCDERLESKQTKKVKRMQLMAPSVFVEDLCFSVTVYEWFI